MIYTDEEFEKIYHSSRGWLIYVKSWNPRHMTTSLLRLSFSLIFVFLSLYLAELCESIREVRIILFCLLFHFSLIQWKLKTLFEKFFFFFSPLLFRQYYFLVSFCSSICITSYCFREIFAIFLPGRCWSSC